jgi:hypothetical protein
MTDTAQFRLNAVLKIAEDQFLSNVEALADLRRRADGRGRMILPQRDVTRDAVRAWLDRVTHNVHGQHRKTNIHATAHYRQQKITYNPIYGSRLGDDWEVVMLDLVLHELGHLFTYWFLGTVGHEWSWKSVGHIVGYVPIGSTRNDKRGRLMAHYSPMKKAASTAPRPMPTPAAPRTRQVRKRSTNASPVATVWRTCDTLRLMGYSRKDMIAECVRRGVNKNTAATQYARWKKARGI